MTTFETAQVGDKVYHYRYGWSTITNIKKESDYPIIIDYDFSFTYEGFADKSDSNPSIFWDEVKIVPPSKPLPKLEVDTKVLVWDNSNCIKRKGHFSHFDEKGKMHVFASGTTSWSHKEIVPYNYWKIVKD